MFAFYAYLDERLQPLACSLLHHLVSRHSPALKRRKESHRLLIAWVACNMT